MSSLFLVPSMRIALAARETSSRKTGRLHDLTTWKVPVEQVAVVRLGSPEDLDHAREQPLGAGAHIDGLDSQPHRVDADHFSSTRSHCAHSAAAALGQVTVIAVPPRRSSTRMSAGTAATGGNANGTNVGVTCAVPCSWPVAGCAIAPQASRSASRTHLRTMFAFNWLASATAAIDTPGCRHARMTVALNSALWRRRPRPTGASTKVSICPHESYADTRLPCRATSIKVVRPSAYSTPASASSTGCSPPTSSARCAIRMWPGRGSLPTMSARPSL